MAQAKDIKIFTGGKWTSVPGQKAHDGTAWRIPKGGTAIYQNGQWYRYKEALNASITIGIISGTAINIAFQSLPSTPFRPIGMYYTDKQIVSVQVKLTGQIAFTDDTRDAYIFTAGPFVCDGQVHTVTDSTSIPSGKIAYQITGLVVDIIYTDTGALSYKTGDVKVTSEPVHFTAQAFVYPTGAGTATATPSNPTYGQIVTFTATDAPGYTFTEWLESGKKERSYAVKAYGNIRDTAGFSDTSNVVGFFIRVYMDSSRHICVEARTLQNRSDQFAMVSFTLTYTDTSGMTQTLDYEREVYLNGTPDNHTFTETASSLNSNTKPSVGILPNPLKLGTVEVVLDNGDMLMTQSLRAGYSLWEITADDDDAGPGDPG